MRTLGIIAAVGSLMLLAACSSGSSSSGTAVITLVSPTCAPNGILSGQTSTCTATVSGTGSYSSAVTWTASGGGTISPVAGIFTAATVPFTTQVTITATSVQDVSKTGTTLITVAAAGSIKSVTAACSPSTVTTGQLTQCSATVQGDGNYSPNVTWSASGGTINPLTGLFSAPSSGSYTITATSQQDQRQSGTATVTVQPATNNVVPIVVDSGPLGTYVNGAFASVTVCAPGSSTQCQTIDHVLVDTGSTGLRLLAKAAGGELDPAIVPLPLQNDASGNSIAECNQFADGFTWGSVSQANLQMAGEIATNVPDSSLTGVPVQLIGDLGVPAVPSSCSSTGANASTLAALGANGVLGVSTYMQDCGSNCASNTAIPNVYYSCSSGSCQPTLLDVLRQVQNPVWLFPQDNNGVLLQLPSIPAGGTTPVTGSLIFGVGTQTNNALGSAAPFILDSNGYFITTFPSAGSSAQNYTCSHIASGSNANYFLDAITAGLTQCVGTNKQFYCQTPAAALLATNQSAVNNTSGTVSFNVGDADQLLARPSFTAFAELAGPNPPPSGCNGSFDWGLSFFYGKSVFTAIENKPVTGTSFVGPFWAYF